MRDMAISHDPIIIANGCFVPVLRGSFINSAKLSNKIIITHGNFAKPIGVNSEGLKRRNFNENQLSCIKKGFKAIYRKDNSLEQALIEPESLANEEEIVNLYIDFIKKSTRGLIR